MKDGFIQTSKVELATVRLQAQYSDAWLTLRAIRFDLGYTLSAETHASCLLRSACANKRQAT